MFNAQGTLLDNQWFAQHPEAPKADKNCVLKQMDEQIDAELQCELKKTQ